MLAYDAYRFVSHTCSYTIIQVDESGQIIYLERHCPWKKHFNLLTKELSPLEPDVKLVLYEETNLEMWMVHVSTRPV